VAARNSEAPRWLSQLTAGYGAAGAIATALNLVAMVVLVRVVSVERFGIVDLIRTIQWLLMTAFSLNVFHSASRFCLDSPDLERQRALLGGGLIAQTVAGCVAGLALLAIAPLGHWGLGLSIDGTTLWTAALGVPAGAVVDAFVQTAVIRSAPGKYAMLLVSQAALTCTGTYVLVLVLGMDVSGYFVTLLLASLIVGAVGMWLLRSEYSWHSPYDSLRRHLSFGAPFTVASLIQYGFAVFVRVLLIRVAPPEALGWYGLAERAQVPMNLTVAAAGRAWLPWLLTERPPRGSDVSGPVIELSAVVLAVFGTMMIFLSDLLGLVGGGRYEGAYPAAMLLLIAGWIYFLGDWIASGTLSLTAQTRYRISIFGAAYGLGVLVALWTVGMWGSTGVAVAVVVVSTLVLVGMVVVSARLHPLRHGFRRIVPASAALAGLAVCGSLSTSYWLKVTALALYAVFMWYAGILRVGARTQQSGAPAASLAKMAQPR
jgi:O-antigen/teichoic acid export membrane protein